MKIKSSATAVVALVIAVPEPATLAVRNGVRHADTNRIMGMAALLVPIATRPKALLCVAALAGVLASACGKDPTSPSPTSLSVGQWNGTTAQGMAITFTVSSDEILRTLSVGHRFNSCSGTQTFSNLEVATAPDVICIPGPCSGTSSTYRAFGFSSGSRGTGPSTAVNGVFLPGDRAQGVAAFHDFPSCGTVTGVEWTATRR